MTVSTTSFKYTDSNRDIWRLRFLFCNTDEYRFHSYSKMKARLSYLSYEKRPTSGDVTHIRTLRDDVDAIASTFKGLMVLVVLSRVLLYSHFTAKNKITLNLFLTDDFSPNLLKLRF